MFSHLSRFKITLTLILLNSIVYLISVGVSHSLIEIDTQTLVDMGALFGPYTVLYEQWWRLFSAMFLHGGMTHLLMNMVSLYLVGRGVESYFSSKAYLLLYLFSGLFGGIASLYMHPVGVGVGASGAIFGIFGAMAGFFVAHHHQIQAHTKAFMKDFAVILGINLVLGFSIASIDVSAHVGGLIVGSLGGFFLAKYPKLLWLYGVVMLLLLLLSSLWLSSFYATLS